MGYKPSESERPLKQMTLEDTISQRDALLAERYRCYSAWGPNADRRGQPIDFLICGGAGSNLGAYLQTVRAVRFEFRVRS